MHECVTITPVWESGLSPHVINIIFWHITKIIFLYNVLLRFLHNFQNDTSFPILRVVQFPYPAKMLIVYHPCMYRRFRCTNIHWWMHIKIHLYAPMHMNSYATRILTRNAHVNSEIIHKRLQNIISGDKPILEEEMSNWTKCPKWSSARNRYGLTILGREILAVAAPGMRDFSTYWRRTWLPLKEVISVFRKNPYNIEYCSNIASM